MKISKDDLTALPTTDIASVRTHQNELMGTNREPAESSQSETFAATKLKRLVHSIVRKQLPKKYRVKTSEITTAIINEANKYQMDPLFILAIIKNESNFNPKAIGLVGEIGLMQIRPFVAKELSRELGIKKYNLANPVDNIKLGTYFFSKLRDKYNRDSHMYLSAYNVGPAKLRKLLRENKKPKLYVNKVMTFYTTYHFRFEVSLTDTHNIRKINSDGLLAQNDN